MQYSMYILYPFVNVNEEHGICYRLVKISSYKGKIMSRGQISHYNEKCISDTDEH